MARFRMMYVVGFVFRYCPGSICKDVFLVKKNPRKESMTWQKNLWNGVGGGVVPGEHPSSAMTREWQEEVGQSPHFALPGVWRHFAVEHGHDYELHCFTGECQDIPKSYNWPPENDAGEKMEWVPMSSVPDLPVLGNLRWMLPLAQDWRGFESAVHVSPIGKINRSPTWR